MRVSNGVYKQVKINWAGITLPLKEGTPVSNAGAVANNGNAVGLVPQTYTQEPLMKSIYVLTGGDVDLAEVNTLYGSNLETAAKANMAGIRFHKADGSIDDSADSTYTLPAATTEALGGVKMAANVAASEAEELATLVTSFNSLLSALKTAGIMEADAEAEETT